MSTAARMLADERVKAADAFARAGLPHRRIEEWKYSDLRNVIDADDVSAAGSAAWSRNAPQGIEFADLSKDAPEWVRAHWGKLRGHGAMDEAAIAFSSGGLALRVHAGLHIREALQLDLITGGHGRVLIVLEDGASLTLMEQHKAPQSFENIELEIVIGASASLAHVRLMPDAAGAVRVENIYASLGAASQYRGHFLDRGGKLSRLDVKLSLRGEGAQAHLSGANVLINGHGDVTTHVDHVVGHTLSTQLFKHVAGGKSRAVYQGKVTVCEGAAGSDSRQTAKGLLLNEHAEIDLKPELEIFADDVKCAHGAAVGDLDVDSLFYLRARGIPEVEARALLIRAFLEDAVAEIEDEDIRARVWCEVEGALARANEASS